MANWKLAKAKTGGNEGGYALVKGDRGGETYCGISRVWWPKWAGWKIIDAIKAKRKIAHGEIIHDPVLEGLVDTFYKSTFWDILGADDIEDQQTAERLYDFGVTSGQSRSIKEIQEVLGLEQTGKISDELIAAINDPAKYLLQ
jgi:lysozyme family protein